MGNKQIKDQYHFQQFRTISIIKEYDTVKTYLVQNPYEQKFYILKAIPFIQDFLTEEHKQLYIDQVNSLKQFPHNPSILSLKDYFIENDYLWIFREYVHGCSFEEMMSENDLHYFDERELSKWFISICNILSEIYSQNMFHGNIKPSNIFLDQEKNLKITDFKVGVSNSTYLRFSNEKYINYYFSPEEYEQTTHTSCSEIWTLGATFYFIAAQKPPFKGNSQFEVYSNILENNQEPLPKKYSPELNTLIQKMLTINPAERISFQEIRRQLAEINKKASAANYHVSRSFSQRRELEESKIKDRFEFFINLVKEKCKSIEDLDLQFTNIGTKQIAELSKNLKGETYSQIKTLNLSINKIGNKASKFLSPFLSHNNSLLVLNISRNKIKKEGAKFLKQGLKSPSHIYDLDISFNFLGDDGFKHICKALHIQKQLMILNLTRNKITNKGFAGLHEVLKKNPEKERITLDYNEISDVGISDFLDQFSSSNCLTPLLINNNKISPQKYIFLAEQYAKRKNFVYSIYEYECALLVLKKTYSDSHPIISDLYQSIAEMAKKNTDMNCSIYYFNKSLEGRIGGNQTCENIKIAAATYVELGTIYAKKHSQISFFYFRKAIKFYKSVDVKYIPACLEKLSRLFQEQGNYEESIKYSKKSIKMKKTIELEEPQQLAKQYFDHASLLSENKQFQKAIKYYNKSISLCLKIFGPQSLNIANCYYHLGLIYQEQEHFDVAIEHLKQALEIRKKKLGSDNVVLLANYNSLGDANFSRNEIERSIFYYKKAVDLSKKLFGEDSLCTDKFYNLLGSNYQRIRRFSKAIQCYESSLSIRNTLHGDAHDEIIETYCKLASIYAESMENYHKGFVYYQTGVAKRINLKGDKIPILIYDYSKLSEYLYLANQNEQSLIYFNKANNLYENLPSGQIDLQDSQLKYFYESHLWIAGILGKEEKKEEALNMSRKGLKMFKQKFGKLDLELEHYYLKMISFIREIEEESKIIKYYNKAMEITKHRKEPNSHLSEIFFSMAEFYERKDFKKQKKYLRDSVKFGENSEQKHKIQLAGKFLCLGRLYRENSQIGKADIYISKAFEIVSKNPGYDQVKAVLHEESGYLNMDYVLSESLENFELALKIRSQYLGPNHPDTLSLQKAIALFSTFRLHPKKKCKGCRASIDLISQFICNTCLKVSYCKNVYLRN